MQIIIHYFDYIPYHITQTDINYKGRIEKTSGDLTVRKNNFSPLLGIDRIHSQVSRINSAEC